MTEAPVIDIESLVLGKGGHENPEKGMCVMEAYCYVNRLPFSDRPGCVCPALAGFLRNWNDGVDDAERQFLKRYITDARLGGTNDGKTEIRTFILADWAIRDRLPLLLEMLEDEKASRIAAELRSSALIKDLAELALALPLINEARARALALDLALDLDLALALDLARDLALDLALDLARARARALALALDLDLASAEPGGGSSASATGAGEVEVRQARVDVFERMLAA